jgi:hypothetical protein
VTSHLESDGQYVVINNFLFANDPHGSTVKRNYSALNFNGLVPTVNLKRSDRNRAEARLADVWTRELLPFNATNSKPQKEPSSAMIIRRLSMLSLLSGGSKRSSQGQGSEFSEDTHWEEDCEYEGSLKRSSTAFAKTKSLSYKSAPPSPTKRSSSLSSRFSFNSGGRREAAQSEKANVTAVKRRSIMPHLDSKRKTFPQDPVGSTLSVDFDAALAQTWGREEGYFSNLKPPTTPAPANSVQEEELGLFAALEDEILNMRARETIGANEVEQEEKPEKGKGKRCAEGRMIRRHTTMASPPRQKHARPWRSVKRVKQKASSDALRLVR